MEVDMAAIPGTTMPATAVPATKVTANHDVGAAVVVVVAARITVIAAVIICGRADSPASAKRPRVESHLRHCRRSRGRCQQSRRTNSKRKLSHYLLLSLLRSERETRSGATAFPGTRLRRGNLHEQYFRK